MQTLRLQVLPEAGRVMMRFATPPDQGRLVPLCTLDTTNTL